MSEVSEHEITPEQARVQAELIIREKGFGAEIFLIKQVSIAEENQDLAEAVRFNKVLEVVTDLRRAAGISIRA